jgi:hypothetical protein
MSKAVQLRFHDVVSKTGLVYGSKCWTLRSGDKHRIEAAQMRFLCGLKGVTSRGRQQIEDIRDLFELNKMTNDV